MNILMISISGGKPSKSRTLADHAAQALVKADPSTAVAWLDLADEPLPPYRGSETWSDPGVRTLTERIAAAEAIVIAAPVYNYSLPAAAKSLVELTGDAWEEKIVAFLCSAGGSHSYMASIGFANALMLDFRCVILPRFVYATSKAFAESGDLTDPEILARIDQFAADLLRLKSWSR